ncbi:MAG: hypothetical protein Q4G38_05255 [Aeriscardovia aeriphila]|nr:hypothetical protein [Aeriscardovia aeriphila]
MKRKDLANKLSALAKQYGESITWSEGGNHSKVTIGNIMTAIPRHTEINEITAKQIIKYFERKLNEQH